MDLKSKVNQYKGLVTFSDIHAHIDMLRAGVNFAIRNDLYMVFLGDLVDGHDKPLQTVIAVKAILDEDRGVLVVGNHEDKFYRYAKGNKVMLKRAQQQTLADVGNQNIDLFLRTIIELIEHRNTSNHWKHGNWVFTHGACAKEFWDIDHSAHSKDVKKKILHKALYGEVTGKEDEFGFPIRDYRWVDHIPTDHHVVVGHDRHPIGAEELHNIGPLRHKNSRGGSVIFTDTGCGKSDTGYLTLTVFKLNDTKLEFVGYEAVRG